MDGRGNSPVRFVSVSPFPRRDGCFNVDVGLHDKKQGFFGLSFGR